MAQTHPASTTTPLYLTGDKAGLREFLDKFDVSPTPITVPIGYVLPD
jgi:hypothetical protein